MEVKENGWAVDVTDARESTSRNLLSVRFILTAGVAGSTGALGPLMTGDMAGGRLAGMAVGALLTSFGAKEEVKEKAAALEEGLGALKEKPDVVEPSEKPEGPLEFGAGREKEKFVEDTEVGRAEEVAAAAAGGGAVKDKVAGGRAVPKDAGTDGKMEDAEESGAEENEDDLAAGALSPSSGSGTAATVSCVTPGLRFSKEKGHRTPSVDSSISVGAGGNLFSSDRCMSSWLV